LNPNFFKSKTQIIENGVYAIGTAFKYGNEIWYLLKNNTENHPLVMVRNTKNGLEEKHLKFIPESFKFHEFLKPFSYNEDLYIAINNGQIINTNTH
jgi:sulfur carrier protein ThiS